MTASIAAVWTTTAASASASEPDAVISRTGPLPMQIGTSAGTSIRPAPCAVDIMNDHSASPAWPVGARGGWPARRDRCATTTTTSSAPASACSAVRSTASPNATTAATSTTDSAWPAAIGSKAFSACARSRACTPHAAANIQPAAGFSP